ncbi:DEAD/DEAH box helicase [Aeromicrobium sp. 636]|uniref:Probable DNA 3'-5' helicase RecG n=1 Tax=Aeromicrobium senzhongii TaxID=2663859 RepID=A0A8I0ET70_9ACTN|nr:ATP-dependent DNA helicase RecG [Aeromicrobium sp. 636]MBC9225584.1 ATP-dependent DNA helicase RecG [Aeromicrobium senzhongii]MCQ3997693.1 DEAD/DEAH box helicase [Aeromicrobium sp. 636]
MIDFDTRLSKVVGDSAKKLEKAFGHRTVGDLLRHFPRRYIDLEHADSFDDLEPGQIVAFVATVLDVKKLSFRNNPRMFRVVVTLSDGSSTMEAVFFNQFAIAKTPVGSQQLLSGEVSVYQGRLQLASPQMRELPPGKTLADLGRGGTALPIYPAGSGLTSWDVERSVHLALDVVDTFPEPIPAQVRSERGLLDAATAYEYIHRPRKRTDWVFAQTRLRFEEAFEVQAVFARRRLDTQQRRALPRPGRGDGIRVAFEERLPFTLTEGQAKVAAEIDQDLSAAHPMHRLLQGEVGSGKTIVALLAMLQVVDSGGQAALLAPTEVLATQHHRSIERMLGDLAKGGMLGGADEATRVRLLTGSMGAKARQQALLDIVSGEAGIVIGTHALLEETVQFADLGLVVIDEQHRFGVEQRSVLSDRAAAADGVSPHVLVMTATPIPRTIAMTVFGDLEVSTLRELPAGRQPIQTNVVPVAEQPAWLERAWQRVHEEVGRGRQAYVVVSRIGEAVADEDTPPPDDGEDEKRPTVGLVELAEALEQGPLAGLRLGRLHGRMPADEKDVVMSAFAAGDLDVLVATTVVEVGVDVPNATMMIVMDADRFGVSQLHQLRGRVGRGSEPGLCLLVTGSPAGTPARERLSAVAASTDGFELSRLDAELRREGDVLGARQSGVRSSLKLLSVVRDEQVIVSARDAAVATLASGDVPPDLEASIRRLEESERADYLERA